MFTHASKALIAAAALALLPSSRSLAQQGVVVKSASDVQFFGALGTLAGLAARMGGGNMHDIQSTISIAGHKLRTDNENAASIIDADAGRMTYIDHKQKTYTSMTFDEMAALMQQGAQQMRGAQEKAKAEQAKDPKAAKGDVNFKYSASVDRPGQRDKVAGYDAERVFVTINIDAEATPEGQKTEQVGTMVFLVDEWRSRDAPQIAAIEEFQRAYAQRAGQAFRQPVKALDAAYSYDPRIKGGFEAAAKELAKVPGIPLRSVTYVAIVPAGMTFDRALVLGDAASASAEKAKAQEEPKKGRFGGLMGAIKSAAENANKQPASNESKDKEQMKQVTLLSVTDEVKSIDRGPVSPEAFTVPSGYREVTRKTP